MKMNAQTKAALFLFIGFYPAITYAINHVPIGAKSKAMAGNSVAVTDFWSLYNNAAIMPFSNKNGIGLYYDNRFLLKETSTLCLGGQWHIDKAGAFGFYTSHFGYKNYAEWNIGLAYAKSFADIFSFGLQFDYLLHYFGDKTYGKSHAFTFEIGMYGKISKSLSLGFHVYNPARLKTTTYNQTKEYIPTVFRFGLAYRIAKKCLLSVEVEKDMEYKPLFRIGMEYELASKFYLRGGFCLPEMEFALGAGLHISMIRIDFASTYHSVLGYSPQISLIYTIKDYGKNKGL